MRLQQMIDNGYADKLTDYPEYRNFERIQIGEFLISIYHPSKDEYVAQLIQNDNILDSESFGHHYPAFNKCLEYMQAALDVSDYTDVQDWIDHPNSMVNAINKQYPIVYYKNLGSEQYVLGIIFNEPNWIEYRDTVPLIDALGIHLVSKEGVKIVPEVMEDFKLISGIPREGWGYKMRCFNPYPGDDELINAIVRLNIPAVTFNYLQHLLEMKSFLEEEISNTIYEIDEPSKIELIRGELNKIDNLWQS